VVLKDLPACSTELFAVLLEALLDGVVAICQLLSTKPRCIARAGLMFLRRAVLRSRIAPSQNQRGNCYQDNSAHLFLQDLVSLLQHLICDHQRVVIEPSSGRARGKQGPSHPATDREVYRAWRLALEMSRHGRERFLSGFIRK
jgi:hypothetical protein